jgi:hypothetical protein
MKEVSIILTSLVYPANPCRLGLSRQQRFAKTGLADSICDDYFERYISLNLHNRSEEKILGQKVVVVVWKC